MQDDFRKRMRSNSTLSIGLAMCDIYSYKTNRGSHVAARGLTAFACCRGVAMLRWSYLAIDSRGIELLFIYLNLLPILRYAAA